MKGTLNPFLKFALKLADVEGGRIQPVDRSLVDLNEEWADLVQGGAQDVREVLRRVGVFRTQIATTLNGVIPTLFLPDAPMPTRGRCISCGESIWRCISCLTAVVPEAPAPTGGRCISCGESIWRCVVCLMAVYVALGEIPPPPGDSSAS